MAADVSKQLERAKKFLEKNRVEDAIEAYLGVLELSPQHTEASQALGDLYLRQDQPERAAVYYGYLFDLLVEPKDETKALAIFNRFLKNSQSTHSCNRSKTIPTKRWNNIPRLRKCSRILAAARTRCSAGNVPRNSTLTICRVS
jgi:tetratricopeptide (TPR) repeat protein